ncbi:MAG: glycosyltransferase [Acidimicrobiaceae bacterium]|nr:glycosyltransferase [Acidimicrobiaceae bacterium]
MRLSLVIPAFNEAKRLAAGFERLAPFWIDDDEHEVVMVDDGSSDDTLRVAHEIYGGLRHFSLVRQEPNQGKGAAVRLGLAQARGRHVIVADADMAIDPRHFTAFDDTLGRVPLAPGARTSAGVVRYATLSRTWGGWVHHRLVDHYTGVTVRDTQCGCKGYRLAEGRLLALFGFIDRFSFDAEMFYLAHRLGLSHEAVPVTWEDVPGSTVRPLPTLRATLRDLRDIPRSTYRNPAVQLPVSLEVAEVRSAVRAARVNGAVHARGATDALVVLGRNDALGAINVAQNLSGTVMTVAPEDLVARTYEAL